MKNIKKILAIVLAAAMLTLLALPAIAGDMPRIPFTAPTPERVFLAVNDAVVNELGFLSAKPYYSPAPDPDSDPVTELRLDKFILEDGTFTDYTKAQIDLILEELKNDEMFDPTLLEGIVIPDNLFDAFKMVNVEIYNMFVAELELYAPEDPEAAAVLAAIKAKYADGEAFYAAVVNACFGDGEITAEGLITAISGDSIKIGDDGIIYNLREDMLYGENTHYLFVGDAIAPSGAYLAPDAAFGNHRNVFAQLKAEYEAGEISAEQAFTLVTGYVPDINGDLVMAAPQYSLYKDKDGKPVYSISDMVNEDGTVLNTNMHVGDFLVERAVLSYYMSITEETDLGLGVYVDFLLNNLTDLLPSDDLTNMTEEEVRQNAKDAITEEEAFWTSEGYTGKELLCILLDYLGGFEYDSFGYIASLSKYEYAMDKGKKINIADVMDEEGNFLTDEYNCETVWELVDFYLADMSTEAILKGDANGDGSISVADVTTMLKFLAEWDVDLDSAAADTNGDSQVSVADVTMALKYLADWDVMFVY